MTLLQAAPMIGTTKPSSSVPESSDRYAQLLTAGNFEIILTLEKIFVRALCTIISLIVHKKNITQTDDHQFRVNYFKAARMILLLLKWDFLWKHFVTQNVMTNMFLPPTLLIRSCLYEKNHLTQVSRLT